MQKSVDADKVLLHILAISAIVFLLLPTTQITQFALSLIVMLIVYEIIIFRKREIYGFTGLRFISLPSLILLSFTLFIAIPGVYIASIKTSPIRYSYFASILLFYILYPAGLLFGDSYKKIEISKVSKLKNEGFITSEFDEKFYQLLIFLFIFCLLIFALYISRTKVFPLFELIRNPGEYLKLKFMREEAFKLLDISFVERYLFHWLRSLFFPFGIVGSLYLAASYRKYKYYILFMLFFFSGLVMNSLTLEKSLTAGIFLSIMSLLYLKKKQFSVRFIIVAFLSTMAFPAIVVYYLNFGREDMLTVVLGSFLNRIFLVPTETLYQYFRIFPDVHEFILGKGTQLFSWLYNEGQFPLANYVGRVWWKKPHTTGFANVNFIGNFWADFGWIGVIISIFLVGFLVHLFYRQILVTSNYHKNFIYVVFISSITTIFTINFLSSNFTTLFISRGLILMIFLLVYISSMKRKSASLWIKNYSGLLENN